MAATKGEEKAHKGRWNSVLCQDARRSNVPAEWRADYRPPWEQRSPILHARDKRHWWSKNRFSWHDWLTSSCPSTSRPLLSQHFEQHDGLSGFAYTSKPQLKTTTSQSHKKNDTVSKKKAMRVLCIGTPLKKSKTFSSPLVAACATEKGIARSAHRAFRCITVNGRCCCVDQLKFKKMCCAQLRAASASTSFARRHQHLTIQAVYNGHATSIEAATTAIAVSTHAQGHTISLEATTTAIAETTHEFPSSTSGGAAAQDELLMVSLSMVISAVPLGGTLPTTTRWEGRAIKEARSWEACPGSGAEACGGEENRMRRREHLSKI